MLFFVCDIICLALHIFMPDRQILTLDDKQALLLLPMLLDIVPDVGLDRQRFQCFSCAVMIGHMFGEARYVRGA